MWGFAGICPVKQLCQCPGGGGVRAPQCILFQIEELQSVFEVRAATQRYVEEGANRNLMEIKKVKGKSCPEEGAAPGLGAGRARDLLS